MRFFFGLFLGEKIFFVFLDVQWKYVRMKNFYENWSSLKDFRTMEKRKEKL